MAICRIRPDAHYRNHVNRDCVRAEFNVQLWANHKWRKRESILNSMGVNWQSYNREYGLIALTITYKAICSHRTFMCVFGFRHGLTTNSPTPIRLCAIPHNRPFVEMKWTERTSSAGGRSVYAFITTTLPINCFHIIIVNWLYSP